jgi:lipooligosaccharide transport system ATP-binding protein
LPVLETEGLCKSFRSHWTFRSRPVIQDLNLQVEEGEVFGFLGPNGAGKTTTLKMIYGVCEPSAGQVRVFGLDIGENRRAVRSRLGVTLQDNVLIEALSPIENLRVFGRYHLLREPELSQRIDELIDFLELRSHADVPVVELSGGFQRRLAIAQSLMNRPELLILDEPTTGLDPAVRLALWSRVRELRQQGTSVLLTTHYMDEAERLCDRVAIMSEGRAVCEGSPRELIEARLGRETVEFDCAVQEEQALLHGYRDTPARLRSGNRLMLYANDATPLVQWIHERDGDDRRPLIVRPTNLEDVFLQVTGTDLEGGA